MHSEDLAKPQLDGSLKGTLSNLNTAKDIERLGALLLVNATD